MKSLDRVLTALSHKEADRVPMFLLLNMQGAKYNNMTLEEYYNDPLAVAEAQIAFHKEYDNDIVHSFYYASVEIEAFGGTSEFREDGPTNAGRPIINEFKDIDNLKVPVIEESIRLRKVLETTKILSEKVGGEVLIAGVVMSPYSLPIMQMGFEKYLKLRYEDKKRYNKLMEINKEFCINYANKLIEYGANSIVYFDPVSSPTISSRKEFFEGGFEISKEVISKINGPVVVHYASGIILPIINEILEMGAAGVGTSSKEDNIIIKKNLKDKMTIIGNLNGIEMIRWTEKDIEFHVKKIIKEAAVGGGFIISDNHGEIPLQVPDKVIRGISNAVKKWGKYPLNWINE